MSDLGGDYENILKKSAPFNKATEMNSAGPSSIYQPRFSIENVQMDAKLSRDKE